MWVAKSAPRRIAKAHDPQHDALNALIDKHTAEYRRYLMDMWERQQRRTTDEDVMRMMERLDATAEQISMFEADYSAFTIQLNMPILLRAYVEGAAGTAARIGATVNPYAEAPVNWARQRAADLVTRVTDEQREALRRIITDAVGRGETAQGVARRVRQIVGLDEQRARANARMYRTTIDNLIKQHPRTKRDVLEQRALRAADRYAQRQLAERAKTIAYTEMATAFNQGKYEATREAIETGRLGRSDRRWMTAKDERVCETCGKMDGVTVPFESPFILPNGKQVMVPPGHPRCRCVANYVERERPVYKPLGIAANEINEFLRLLAEDPAAAVARVDGYQ